MQQAPWSDFVKLGEEKQFELVENRPQSQPRPFTPPTQFPQINFMNLTSTQDKKPIKLATYRFPAKQTRGVVIFFHTMITNTAIMGTLAQALAMNGFTFVGFDHRGHGKSEGERGYLDDYKLMINDAKNFVTNIFNTYPNVPIFLFGHGFGGLLSIVFSQQFKQFKFAGIILSSPSVRKPSNRKMPAVLAGVGGFALKLMPNRTELFKPQMQKATSNPNASNYYKNNPEIYQGKVFVGSLINMMQIMEKNEQKNWKKLSLPPIAIIQGQFNKLGQSINTINFFDALTTQDKQLWWYPEMWNNFWFEPEAEEVFKRIINWLNSKI